MEYTLEMDGKTYKNVIGYQKDDGLLIINRRDGIIEKIEVSDEIDIVCYRGIQFIGKRKITRGPVWHPNHWFNGRQIDGC